MKTQLRGGLYKEWRGKPATGSARIAPRAEGSEKGGTGGAMADGGGGELRNREISIARPCLETGADRE